MTAKKNKKEADPLKYIVVSERNEDNTYTVVATFELGSYVNKTFKF